ncbi:MAG TPA: 30S ribosomal protein S1 [Longimicrobiales bacterium]|nr:30S ribosomal protein S1 [Longimicrobiales bacterium]
MAKDDTQTTRTAPEEPGDAVPPESEALPEETTSATEPSGGTEEGPEDGISSTGSAPGDEAASGGEDDDDEAAEAYVTVDALTGEVITEPTAGEEDEPGGIAVQVDAEPPRVGTSPELEMDPYGEEQLDISRDEFAALLGEFEEDFQDIREGEIVNAKVLDVTDAAVILEFGFKSEGSVPLDEFKEPPGVGEEVEVLLESLEDEDGIVVLSKKKADFLRVWEKIKEAYEADRPVKGTLSRKIKGGVTVDLMGVDAFLPGSQIALRRVPNIEDLIGEVYDFKIIKLNKRRRNIVVSRRVILEAEREKKREVLVRELLVGQVREGQVKNITDFGAFIDLGGLDGLLHITDMSWGRVGHPSEVVDIGERLDVKVLDIDWDRERISLGLKQLLPYPWTDIDKKYPVGSRVRGKVVSITNYGAFVELEKGVEGLVHISEMSWTRNVRHPSKLVSIGDEIEAVVLKVDPDDEKISLGMKQIEEDPWLALPLKYPTGTVLTGVVRNLTSFGAFVEIEPGIDGLVHVSDMSWTKRVEHPSEIVQKGEDVEVMVLDVDAENKRISLGLKQLQDDPWPGISERFSPGVESEGKVARVQDKGVVVDLGDDIEGFVPASHSAVPDPGSLEEYYEPGDPVSLKVLESDAANRRIVLEVTEAPQRRAARAAAEEGAEAEPEAEAAAPEAEAEEEAAPVGTEEAAPEAEAEEEGAPEGTEAAGPEAEAEEEVPEGTEEAAPEADAEEEEAPEGTGEAAPEAEAEEEEAPEVAEEAAPEAEAEEEEAPDVAEEAAPEAEAEEEEAPGGTEEVAPEAEAESGEQEASDAEEAEGEDATSDEDVKEKG